MQIMKNQNKLKENQSLEKHLKSISMHLVQREKVSYNDPQFTTISLAGRGVSSLCYPLGQLYMC